MLATPLRAMATINDFLNMLFAGFYFFALGPISDTGLYRQLDSFGSVKIWSGLILFGAIVSQVSFAKQWRFGVVWSQFAQATGWIYALILYAQFGTILAALPYVLRPVLTSAYIYLKASLDDPWATLDSRLKDLIHSEHEHSRSQTDV